MGWYEKSGGHETGDIKAIDGAKVTNDFRDRQGNPFYNEKGMMDFDPVNQQNKETVNTYLTGLGMDPGKMNVTDENFRVLYQYADRQNQGDIADLYTPYESDTYEFHRWAVTDWAIGLWNRGVAGMAGAIMQMPGMIGAAITGGDEGGFWDNYLNGVEDIEKSISFTPSDKATIPITDEMNWHNMGFAIGDGLGFVGDIFLGSKMMGAMAKASKGAKGVQKMQRLGSFLTGTMQMQKDLYREGRRMGLSVGEASRVAIPIASVVSLTEGAALEMLGKIISNPVSRNLGRQALKAELKVIGKNQGKLTAAQFQKLHTSTVKGFGNKMKAMGQKAFQGATIEAVQEGTQTYIEEFGKQVFDMYFSDDKAVKGKGKFGADITSEKAFTKAYMSAFVGAIVGGQVAGGGAMIRGTQGDTVFNYVNDAVINNKPNRLAKLRQMVNNMNKENNPALVRKTIQDMIDFSQRIGGLNIQSPTAKYQLFQLMQIENEFQNQFNMDFGIDKKTHVQVANAYRHNQKKATWLNQAMQMEMQVLINDKKPITNDINKFEKKLDKYHALFNKISKNSISEEQLKNEIEKLESPKAKEIREAVATMMAQKEQNGTSVAEEINKSKKNTNLDYYEYAPGKKASKEVLDDMEKLDEEFRKLDPNNKTTQKQFSDKLSSKYGMDLNEFIDLSENWVKNDTASKWKKKELKQVKTKSKEETKAAKETEEATEKTEEALAEDKASKIEDLENQIKKQKEIVAKLGPEAKIGDNRGYEANLKLKELEKELKIERIAQGRSAKTVSETTGFKHKKDQKFYDDNKEAIEKRIKEIREKKSKPKPKKKVDEKVDEKKKEKTQDQKDREAIIDKRNEIKKELDEVNQKIQSSRKKGKGRKALFNKRQELEKALDTIDKGRIDEVLEGRPKISKEDSTKEELQDERKQIINDGDILERQIKDIDNELKEFKKQRGAKKILNRGKRISLENRRKKLVDAQVKLRDEKVEIDKAIEEKGQPKKKIPLTEEMVPDFVEDKEAVEEEIAETLEEKEKKKLFPINSLHKGLESGDTLKVIGYNKLGVRFEVQKDGKTKYTSNLPFSRLKRFLKEGKLIPLDKAPTETKEDLTEEMVPEFIEDKEAVLKEREEKKKKLEQENKLKNKVKENTDNLKKAQNSLEQEKKKLEQEKNKKKEKTAKTGPKKTGEKVIVYFDGDNVAHKTDASNREQAPFTIELREDGTAEISIINNAGTAISVPHIYIAPLFDQYDDMSGDNLTIIEPSILRKEGDGWALVKEGKIASTPKGIENAQADLREGTKTELVEEDNTKIEEAESRVKEAENKVEEAKRLVEMAKNELSSELEKTKKETEAPAEVPRISATEGVDVMRGSKWGNPFIVPEVYDKNPEYYKKQGFIRADSREDAIQSYEDWIRGTAHKGFQTEKRDAIIAGLKAGELKGKTLKYFKPNAADSHAVRLAKLVAEQEVKAKEETEETEDITTENFTEDDEIGEVKFTDEQIKELEALNKKNKGKKKGPKDQRKSINNKQEQQKNRAKAKDNPELFEKVLQHVQRLFPNIPVHVLRDAIWNLPISTVSQINNLGMMINADQAFQNSALHEAGHMFVKILGRKHPLVRAGMEYIKGTEYFKEAQKLYPEYNVEDQAEEALMNAIADNSLEKIKTKLDGTNAQKFVAWLKRFWNTIKRNLRIVKGKQSVDMFGDVLAYSKANYEINLGFLENFTKDQRSFQHVKSLETVQMLLQMLKCNFC